MSVENEAVFIGKTFLGPRELCRCFCVYSARLTQGAGPTASRILTRNNKNTECSQAYVSQCFELLLSSTHASPQAFHKNVTHDMSLRNASPYGLHFRNTSSYELPKIRCCRAIHRILLYIQILQLTLAVPVVYFMVEVFSAPHATRISASAQSPVSRKPARTPTRAQSSQEAVPDPHSVPLYIGALTSRGTHFYKDIGRDRIRHSRRGARPMLGANDELPRFLCHVHAPFSTLPSSRNPEQSIPPRNTIHPPLTLAQPIPHEPLPPFPLLITDFRGPGNDTRPHVSSLKRPEK